MAHNKLYRNFIILQEDERVKSSPSDKALSGYAKIEAKGDKCKITFYAQNLKKEEDYIIVLICYQKDMKQIIDIGKLNVTDSGKGEACIEYDADNIAGLGMPYDKISGAGICKKMNDGLKFIMYGFMSGEKLDEGWKKCKVVKCNYENIHTKPKEYYKMSDDKRDYDKNVKKEYHHEMECDDKEHHKEECKEELKEKIKEECKEEHREERKKECKECEKACKEEFKECKQECKDKCEEHHEKHKEHYDMNKEYHKMDKEHCDMNKEHHKMDKEHCDMNKEHHKMDEEYCDMNKEHHKMDKEYCDMNKEHHNMDKEHCDMDKEYHKMGKEYYHMDKEYHDMDKKYRDDNDYKEYEIYDDKYEDKNYCINKGRYIEKEHKKYEKCCDCSCRGRLENRFEAYERDIQTEAVNPYSFKLRGGIGEFFENLVKGFEEVKDGFKELSYSKWYKIPVRNIEDMCDSKDYNKYSIIYYPMLNYYPYIKKHGYFMLGYKCDSKGNLKYLVYAIPGQKGKDDQPYGGKSGFVTWCKKREDDDHGFWLMFYDYKNSTIVVPVK